ncbi:MAG: TolC family protein [Bacteroidia bacterium]|nr:TolC family protein [Bacteroidia bacterium]MBT8278982.1 TolC family protein [Bacteroidia bacterium]NND26455.1 TolC family protein [Flavobacteriaceae bacterium]NNK59443.1 TolC family protein [Flavobacteriaceae bacterium]RZW55819.1 MAG: TolC family protein [Flavobacteriaceae bacterium]
MKKMKYSTLSFWVFALFITPLFSQQVLLKSEAIAIALENNYGVKISNNNIKIAENNTNILNSGYLPSLSANAGATYNRDNTEAEFANGDVTTLNGAESSRYNAGLNLNYTLFDGLGRRYNYKILKEQYQLSELQARETIENTIAQLLTVYYTVAQQSENERALAETLRISKNRLTRAEYQFEYGQSSKLAVLNAQVDINNDSINVMNASQQLNNSKRDLGVVLGSPPVNNFEVDTLVTFLMQLNRNELLQKAKTNNVALSQIDRSISLSEYNVKLNASSYLPTIGLTGTYGWNKNNNNAASFVAGSTNTGLSAGVNLSWNLFDGGGTITRVKNANIELENQMLQKDELLLTIETEFNKAWDDYQNKLSIYYVQESNIITSKNNFERTEEQFKIGQVTSIEFRQAQLNLLNSEINRNRAKYDAKIAELLVLQLSGELLNIEF